MKWSQAHIFTLREAPADAEIKSHQLMMRGGYIRKLGPGLYTYQNLCLRAIRKIEKIVREELDSRGGTEVLMPMVQPKEIWEESGRWDSHGAQLLKFQNRNEQWYCLGPTHEEVVTDLIRKDVRSYRDLPRNIYQIQTKYRDEIRPRFGLMRGREFIMKDAYTFDRSVQDALKSYEVYYQAYKRIFERLGLKFRIVNADAGNIGGSQTHEFQVLAEAGEDHIMACDTCDFAANVEIAPLLAFERAAAAPLPKEEFSTPGAKSIQDLVKLTGIKSRDLVKTMYFKSELGEVFTVLLQGSDEANPIKIKNALGHTNPPELLSDEEVFKFSGAHAGSCGPIGVTGKILADQRLRGHSNFVVGANKDGFHLRNVCIDRDFKVDLYADLSLAKAKDTCPSCKQGKYQSHRGIEVGHIFFLGTKYSQAMNANFLDEQGKSQVMEMGCYGIGISRTVQAAIEQCSDADGIAWPVPLAPFEVHICLLDPSDSASQEISQKLESELEAKGISVIVDDRDERPGIKFKDADLIGMPLRIVIGKKSIEKGEVEVFLRATKEKLVQPIGEAAQFANSWIKERRT